MGSFSWYSGDCRGDGDSLESIWETQRRELVLDWVGIGEIESQSGTSRFLEAWDEDWSYLSVT